jgi:flagella basal body P-ring formation protein FlgA
MRTLTYLLSAACVAAPITCRAALLRPFSQIGAATVHLADLFDDLGNTPDRVLGAAPAPGARIVLGAAQLAAIARDFDVAWRPASGGEQAVVERRADVLPRGVLDAALRRALRDRGAPDDADIAAPDMPDVLVPQASVPIADISQLGYDAQGGRFTALLSVAAPGMATVQMRVSGQVVAMVRTAVAARHLPRGSLVGADDVRMARVRLGSLRGGGAVQAQSVRGFSVRRDLAEGQPLEVADLARPPMVLRGSLVRMRLDSDGIALSAQGIAAEAGALGERIHVQNPVSHVVVEAEVTGPLEVRVAPREAAVTLVAAQ